jgi:hypothetical protein
VVWLRWRRGELRDLPACAALTAVYLTALGSKENGLIIPALLVAAELVLRAPAIVEPRRRWMAIGALALVGAGWWTIRGAVLGGVAGAAPAEGLRGVGGVGRGLTMLGVVPEWTRLLIWPAHLQGDYSPWEITPYARWTAAQTLGLLITATFVVASVIAWRRHRGAAFALAWVAIALAPVSNVIIPTGILLAERTLFLASVGVVFAVAALLPDPAGRGRRAPIVVGVVGLLLTAGAARSFVRMGVYRDLDSSVEALGRDAPRSWRTMMILGIRRMETGHREEGERLLAAAHAAWPAATRPIQLLAFYQRLDGRCDGAVPWLEESLRLDPTDTWTRLPYVACLLDLGRYADAGVVARAGAGADVNGLALAHAALVADSALAARAPTHTVRLPPIRGGLTLVGTGR